MIEPKHFWAITAAARCAAGEFELCGCKLEPFSFVHSIQLDAIGNPLWAEVDTPISDEHYFQAAAICAHRVFVGGIPSIDREDRKDFNRSAAAEIWRRYQDACYGSRPEIWESNSPAGRSRAPIPEFVATFILRHLQGFTREQIFTMAISEVMWIFESLVEQIGEPRIKTAQESAEMEEKSTPEANAARALREKLFNEINGAVKDPGRRRELLAQLVAGTLPDWRKDAGASQRAGESRRG